MQTDQPNKTIKRLLINDGPDFISIDLSDPEPYRRFLHEITAKLRELKKRAKGNITGSLGELVRTLKPHIDRENVRVGTNLIVGSLTQ
jgi:hypothetical protein